jgi:uncharacterized protein (TIRG00374 family)
MIGHFFNVFLPGSVGGDVVRAYYVARSTTGRRTEAVTTILIDRLIGLISLLALASTIMIVRFRFFADHPRTKLAMILIGALVVATVAGLFTVFRRNLLEQFALFRRLEQRTSLGRVLGRVYNAFHLCLNHRGLLTRTMLLSLANHVSIVGCVFLIGEALELGLSFAAYLTVFPLINAVASIPVTPGGLGTREAATIYLLHVFGVPDAQAITLSLLAYAVFVAWSVAGGIIYATSGRPGALAGPATPAP